ncbi:hypothetical protein V8C44DRAFT_336824 [Trichoderma aethiopicum]
MGFLDFLTKRPSVDTTSSQKSQAMSSNARGVLASRQSGTRTPDPSQRLLKPRLVGISEGPSRTISKGSESAKTESQLKAIEHSTSGSKAGLSLNSIPKYDDRERPHSRGVDRLTPLTPNFSLPRRRSSAFIDILDAQGELKSYDFKSRVQASGSRDYGEDVADRNIQPAVSGSTLVHGSRRCASTRSFSKHIYAVPVVPNWCKGIASKVEPADRPASQQASLRDRPRSRGRLSPAVETFARTRGSSGHKIHDHRLQSKSSYGHISITGSPASTPQQAPRTADGRYMRDEDSSFPSELSASPPGIPRYKPRQYSLPSSELLSGAVPGSVRSARATLNKSLMPPHSDRSKQLYQQRCKTPTSPNQLHSFRYRVESDWSRFNRHAGEHLQPAVPHWDDAASSHSEYAPSFAFGSTGNLQLENTDRQPSVRTFGKRGSISSFAHSDYSSHHLSGSRSVGTADTSIDIPAHSLFNKMSFGGGSSRNLRSRGGDSYIAPEFTGKEDESCGESIFISPATPVEEQPFRNPLSPSHRGLSVSSYDATSISDSDVDSFRDKYPHIGRDGEALLFRDEGFGNTGKSLPGLFSDSDYLLTPKWPDTPMTPTDASEMGDDEASVVGMPLDLQKLRPGRSRPLTQRERLLALGYDYDSDSDTEYSTRTDELPEERALELISSLMKGTASAESKNGQHVDEKTIVKLRKDNKRRRMLEARKGRKFSSKENSETEATALGITVAK